MKPFFFRNWELKAMALLLAVLLWAAIRSDRFPAWFGALAKP